MTRFPHLSTLFHTFPHLTTPTLSTYQTPTTTPSYRGVGVWCGADAGVVAGFPHPTPFHTWEK